MSSSNNNFYKSRLFRFINRQYLKLNNQFEKKIRQFKVAASWAIQLLLYPIYILVQTGRLGGKQLEEKILNKQNKQQQKKLYLVKEKQLSPKSDKPIQQVLKTLKPWLSPSSLSKENLTIYPANSPDSLSISENSNLQQLQIIEVITSSNNANQTKLSNSDSNSNLVSFDLV